MGRFGFHSVFSRLFVSVFLALIVFATAMFLLAQAVNNNSTTVRNRAIAKQIANQIDPFVADVQKYSHAGNRLQTRFSLVVIKKSFDIFDESLRAKIGLYSPQKELLVQTDNTELPKRLEREYSWLSEILPTLSGEPTSYIQIKTPSGYTLWYESRIPPKRSRFLGIFNLFTGTVLLFGIMTLVLWWIAKSMTWRLNELGEQMKRLGDGDFSVRVSEQGNDEIAMLAYGFNQSAQKIEQLINANNLLLAHASHEFRTPITRMRLHTEMIELLGGQLDNRQETALIKRTKAINRDLNGLNELIESILLISRLDAGQAVAKLETIDFLALVSQECVHFPESALYGEAIFIQSQPNLITHLVRNLLNNALLHGIPPISVYVYGCQTSDDALVIPTHLALIDVFEDESMDKSTNTLTPLTTIPPTPSKNKTFFNRFQKKESKPTKPIIPNFAVLAVIDEGTGVPADKREDIFSPFVRLKQEKKGSGLGLSLVAQITEVHNGRILTDTWQGKTRFLVILPIKQKQKIQKP